MTSNVDILSSLFLHSWERRMLLGQELSDPDRHAEKVRGR